MNVKYGRDVNNLKRSAAPSLAILQIKQDGVHSHASSPVRLY